MRRECMNLIMESVFNENVITSMKKVWREHSREYTKSVILYGRRMKGDTNLKFQHLMRVQLQLKS